ncbi:hypothetical protein RFI_12596, partial [Reticulomyxa filosa]
REPYVIELPKKSNETVNGLMQRCYNELTTNWMNTINISKEKEKDKDKDITKKCSELNGVINLLMDLFDAFISQLQYKDIGELHQTHLIKKYFIKYNILPRHIYGFEHLFRLFYLLPSIFTNCIRLHRNIHNDYLYIIQPLYHILQLHIQSIFDFLSSHQLSSNQHWQNDLVSIQEMKRLWRVNRLLPHIFGKDCHPDLVQFPSSDEDVIASDCDINQEFGIYDDDNDNDDDNNNHNNHNDDNDNNNNNNHNPNSHHHSTGINCHQGCNHNGNENGDHALQRSQQSGTWTK